MRLCFYARSVNNSSPRTMFLRHIVRRQPVQKPPHPRSDTCGFRRLNMLRAPSHHWRPDHACCLSSVIIARYVISASCPPPSWFLPKGDPSMPPRTLRHPSRIPPVIPREIASFLSCSKPLRLRPKSGLLRDIILHPEGRPPPPKTASGDFLGILTNCIP